MNEKIKRIKSADYSEMTILRVLITDRQFDYYNQKNLIKITYEEILQKDKLFDRLSKFLNLEYRLDESVYNTHSQLNSIGGISIEKRYRYSDDRRNKLKAFQEYVTELL